jgi:CRP/FNR family transcriptional regulator, cyclic AMP receptor protein
VQEERRALWYLKKIPLLVDLGAEELSGLANVVNLEEIRRRRVIFLPGDPGTSVFFVNGGRVKISRVTRDGKELTLAYRGPGEVFGELCLVDGGPRAEMAEAMENALITEVPREEFEKLLGTHATIGMKLTKILCERRRDLENKVEDLVFRDVNAKLAELLLRLGADYGVDDARGTLVAVKITHQEMANLIGSTRETVSLTLSQFKRNKLIATDGRKIILVDRESLKALI